MDGLEAKLNKILSDPEALGSVLEMAKSLAGSDSGGDGGREAHPDERGRGAADDAPGLLEGLAAPGGLGGLGELLGGMDPAMIGKLMGLVGEYTREDDRRTHLLQALKPYIRPERQGKMDRAAQIVKLARTARKAIGSFGGDADV